MKPGDLLNFGAGLAAGAIVLAAAAQAAPVPPLAGRAATVPAAIEQAVVSQDSVGRMKPVEVRWHHHYWHRHHWHHHHWHHRHR
ncbi:twin-arginine translocation (Tat) [Bradyrhizobium sp.]|uniref:twin-arginine translocation (Tat) n=1 Tax=Bradyrhizobium sp. TaxID=376 RepID=UPI0023854D68|nr:twin-arginine translocation (Tat) [Bradyrhizobium sp.]MDE1935012.1 twin-arginine translocation (Tat) [Bradyrhizobium sp.]